MFNEDGTPTARTGKILAATPMKKFGEIDDLMASLKTYSHALVYQTVSELEDSYDFEGMMEAGKHHNELMMRLRKELEGEEIPTPVVVGGSNLSLYLGLGCMAAALVLFLLLRFVL